MTTDFKSIPIIGISNHFHSFIQVLGLPFSQRFLFCQTDVGPLVAKGDDLKMGQDPSVREVIKQLDQACRETGFFYVVY